MRGFGRGGVRGGYERRWGRGDGMGIGGGGEGGYVCMYVCMFLMVFIYFLLDRFALALISAYVFGFFFSTPSSLSLYTPPAASLRDISFSRVLCRCRHRDSMRHKQGG